MASDPKKILVVDDEEILTRTFVKLLKHHGYDAYFVKSGHDAVEAVQEVDFDLIITDIKMPGLSGYETLKAIRCVHESGKKKHPPEIVVTGYADPVMEQQVRELEPAAFVYKPFDLEELLGHVKRLIG